MWRQSEYLENIERLVEKDDGVIDEIFFAIEHIVQHQGDELDNIEKDITITDEDGTTRNYFVNIDGDNVTVYHIDSWFNTIMKFHPNGDINVNFERTSSFDPDFEPIYIKYAMPIISGNEE